MNRMLFNGLLVLTYVLLNSYGALIIKHEINKKGKIDISSIKSGTVFFLELFRSPFVLSGFIAIFASAFVWMAALSRMDISLAYPAAVGLNFLVVVGIAILFFGEPLQVNKIIGILLILASIYFLSKS